LFPKRAHYHKSLVSQHYLNRFNWLESAAGRF
jgi:hypothetical protein